MELLFIYFSGDGLRADLLFSLNPFPHIPGSPRVVAPFLHAVASERGAFGISILGFQLKADLDVSGYAVLWRYKCLMACSPYVDVALIGGMYEDVSAVTKG